MAAKAKSKNVAPVEPVVPDRDIRDDYIEGDHPTANPDGVTNSNHDYLPKTQEEKAGLVRVPFADTVETGIYDAYPTGEDGEPGYLERYDENFFQAHGYRREGAEAPPEAKPEPVPDPVKMEV